MGGSRRTYDERIVINHCALRDNSPRGELNCEQRQARFGRREGIHWISRLCSLRLSDNPLYVNRT
jgi:hypothetical protein